ncbi:integrase core domain-containing protein [Streptomyces sp. NBC_01426]|uniref:integrase core domain-containing protein n=1 Tax=Streptomyces sp. NBC_01426 TaxID=2975866 RepID=UPI003FCC8F01
MHRKLFSTFRQARLEIFQWLTYYNARRRHSALNYLSRWSSNSSTTRQLNSHSQHEPLSPRSGGHLTVPLVHDRYRWHGACRSNGQARRAVRRMVTALVAGAPADPTCRPLAPRCPPTERSGAPVRL